jgi:methylenetetrahydrofolate dehydrogenase (NADP+) / methenyltetrahydrofolate cyclohydrolase
MKLIDGKEVSASVKANIKKEVDEFVSGGGKQPHLAAVLVGNDGASRTYVNSKVKSCEQCGFKSSLVEEEADITEDRLISIIEGLNNDPDVDGFIVQLPLPDHIDEERVNLAIDPKKDVDGFHPMNVGRMLLGQETYLPATPYGVMQLLEYYNIDTVGKHCVVLGRSNIVGTPMSVLMSRASNPGNATVTLCHSKTTNLKELCQSADIIIAAVGRPEFLTADMVKQDAVIVDVGIHRIEDATAKRGFRLKGDVKFDEVSEKASYITPVPGGVGLMTVASLMMNTLKAAKQQVYKN